MPSASRRRSREEASDTLDPEQDVQDRRVIRQGYRSLLEELDDTRRNLSEHNASSLNRFLRQADELRSKVRAPNEGVLDSKFLLNVSDVGSQMARNMKLSANAFDVEEYITRVATFIGGSARNNPASTRRRAGSAEADDFAADDLESWNWQRLGEIAARNSRRAPVMDHLLGPLSIEQRVRQVTKKTRLLDTNAESTNPEELNDGDVEQNEKETTKLVQSIARILSEFGAEGCNLFEFAINPHSFSNTVENLFYISFLVRDGKVSIDDDNPEGVPILLRCEAPTEDDYAQGLKKRQIVMELDYATYQDLIEAYDIKQSIIPTRKPSQRMGQTGKWYG